MSGTVLGTIRALGLDTLLAPRPSPQRQLALALITAHILFPCSKLAVPRHWQATTLADELGVGDATADDIYAALDWLGRRQAAMKAHLAARHLRDGGLALYDVSSSFYYGRACPLARPGYDRDGKKGLPIIVYGLLTDPQGALSPSRLTPATPPTRRPCPTNSPSHTIASAAHGLSWSATAACSRIQR